MIPSETAIAANTKPVDRASLINPKKVVAIDDSNEPRELKKLVAALTKNEPITSNTIGIARNARESFSLLFMFIYS